MLETSYITHSPEETIAFAEQLAKTVEAGTIITLDGELGSGKTTFTKGFAHSLGITEQITSPTFTLLNLYSLPTPLRGIKKLVHMDAYRLKGDEEFLALGAEDFIGAPDTVSLIEWGQTISRIAHNPRLLMITFTATSPTDRTIVVKK